MSDEASGTKSLRDRVAIVTGSGQGIGRGVAMCLARAGAHVVNADQVSERIASVTSAIEDLGVQALGVATDVSRSDDVERMFLSADVPSVSTPSPRSSLLPSMPCFTTKLTGKHLRLLLPLLPFLHYRARFLNTVAARV